MQDINTPETGQDMESYQLLERIIPRGRAKTIAHYMHCSVDYVRRWCREPESEEGTGQPNPIDRVCHLMDSVFIVNPLGEPLIVEHINNHHRQLVQTHATGFADSGERRDLSAAMLSESVRAVNALSLEGATDHTLCELVQLGESVRRGIEKVQAEITRRRDAEGGKVTDISKARA